MNKDKKNPLSESLEDFLLCNLSKNMQKMCKFAKKMLDYLKKL